MELTMCCPTLFGLEGIVADELGFGGKLEEVHAENGRVLFAGDENTLAWANLNLRCAERVLIRLGVFPAKSFDALFEGVRALPWEQFIPRDGSFPVKGYSLGFGTPLHTGLPADREKSGGGTFGTCLWSILVRGNRREIPDTVFHYARYSGGVSGYLRPRGCISADIAQTATPRRCGRRSRQPWSSWHAGVDGNRCWIHSAVRERLRLKRR